MQHITQLSTQEIYNHLRHFYIQFLLPRNLVANGKGESYKFSVN